MSYEKDALSCGSPFTWSQGESLAELSKPERIKQIKAEFEKRKQRELKNRPVNPLRVGLQLPIDMDDLYGADEGNDACSICTK
jgi:hypothetical protein